MRLLAVALLLAASPAFADPIALTLDEALHIAETRHPNLEATRAQLEAARARLEQAGAGFWPSLTGGFFYQPQTANFAATPGFKRSFSRPPTTGVFPLAGPGQPALGVCSTVGANGQPIADPNCTPLPQQAPPPNDYSLANYWTGSVGINWILFDWGRTYYAWRAAGSNVAAQRATVESQRLQVALDVKLAFYGLTAAEAQARVAAEAVTTQQRHVDQARAFFQVGTRTRIDVASAESEEANAELVLARARGAVEASRAALSAALGEDTWHDYQLVPPPEPPDAPPPDEPAVLAEALRARPELRDYALRARGLDQTARALRGQYLPLLQLQLGPSWAGTDFGSLTTNFSVTVGLSYPLFGMNPLLVHGQVREAQAGRLQLYEQERALKNSVRLEAAQARAALEAAREEVVAAARLLTAARERRDLAEGRYQAGVGSIIELDDAQLAFVNAQFQQISAALDVATARARLDHALGRA